MVDYSKLKLLKSGSVKDIYLWAERVGDQNLLLFRFTDYTSVKDYGRLPFTVPDKGKAICAMSVNNFMLLEEMGIRTTFVAQEDDDAIVVKEVAVVDPDRNDFSRYTKNVLIPIEVIARNMITETSSARKRMEAGTLHPWQLGLTSLPEHYPVILPKAFIDGSTKLRESDEYLNWDQLINLCKMPIGIANEIDIQTRRINEYALSKGRSGGLTVFDFKVEYALDENGRLTLADVPLAVDEITCAYTGSFKDLSELVGLDIFVAGKNHNLMGCVNASKQIIRDHYDAAEPEWVKALEKAKKEKAGKRNYPKPSPIPEKLIELSSEMFKGVANAWAGNEVFTRVRSLDEISEDYKKWAISFYEIRS